MNKKLFQKLGLSALAIIASLSFIGCGKENNIVSADGKEKEVEKNINTDEQTEEKTSNIGQPKEETKINNVDQKAKTDSNNAEKKEKNKPLNVEQKKETKPNDKGQNLKSEKEKETYYYNIINDAMQKQIKYIQSIEDPTVRQSVQSSIGAAVSTSTLLELENPEDAEIIGKCLQKVTMK